MCRSMLKVCSNATIPTCVAALHAPPTRSSRLRPTTAATSRVQLYVLLVITVAPARKYSLWSIFTFLLPSSSNAEFWGGEMLIIHGR